MEEARTLQIHLGPTAFLDQQKVEIEKGDVLTVTRSRVSAGTSEIVLAARSGKGTVYGPFATTLGDHFGVLSKLNRGFWTKGKILFVGVVAAKVAADVLWALMTDLRLCGGSKRERRTAGERPER